MKVLLIFPPLWIPYRPYLSLPSLYAYLKSKGIDVVQKDFNVEAYDLLLSEDYLKGLKKKLEDRFSKIDAKDRLMPGLEQEYYYDLYKAKSSIDYIAGKIDHARDVFRNRRAFYDINALSNARGILKQAQVIISTACFPSGQDLIWPMNARFQRMPSDIEQITRNREDNPFIALYEKHLMSYILEEDPDVVGISITVDGQLIPALTLSRMIKSAHKKAHVVMGGCIVTLLSEVLMKYPQMFGLYFDSAIVNEGEKPLLSLVQHLSESQPLNDMPNLIYLDDGKVRANETLPAEDIDSLPTPSFDGLPLDKYLSSEPVLPILASRGCYWGKCAFCSHGESYRYHYRSRDAGKIADDMQELVCKHGITHFAFSDEAIAPALMSRLCDEIIERGMDIRCSSNVRIEPQFTPKLCRKIYQAGFRLLYFGLESASDRILEHMNKGITRETAAIVCKNAHDAGIWDHLYVFFGFPTETRAEAQETIDFLLSNKDIIHSFSLDNFILAKGAPVAKFPELYGVSEVDSGPANDFNFAYNYKVFSGMTSNEALNLVIEHRDSITREYDSQKFFQLECENVILYLSHFEKSDPYLTAAIKENATNTQTNKKLTRLSAPRLKRSVVLNRIRFDMMDIVNNIVNHQAVIVYPRTTSPIFNPGSGKIWTVEPRVVEFLAFCDGQKTIERIAKNLSKKYNAPQLTIEEDCIAFLQPLLREGYVIL